MSKPNEGLSRPKGEDWNDMFKGVSVKERMAMLQKGLKPQQAKVEVIVAPPPASPHRANVDTYTAPVPSASHTQPTKAFTYIAPVPAPSTYSSHPQSHSAQAEATISRPSAGGNGYDEIDALIGGMNFDSDAPDPSGVYCGRCHKGLSKGDKIFKYGGKTYHPNCWSCSKCRSELGTMEFWFEGKDTLCGKCYKAYARPHCSSCNEAIMEAECTIAGGQKYHVNHFKCDRCQVPLQDDFFGKDGRFYCTKDFAELFNPKCTKCHNATRENYIQVGEGCYHPSCFTCTKCSREIGEGQFAEVNGQVRCSNAACRK